MRTDRRATRLRSNLRASVLDGGAFSFMVGTGETYLPAFVLAVGLGETTAGMIAAAPMLGGAVIQMISPWGVQWMRSLRRWVVFCAVVQTLSLTPLVYFALRGGAPAALIFAAATLYWASGMALSPAWNTWIGSLVPRRLRAHFFGRRVRVTQGCLLTGLISGGLILHHFAEGRREISAFALLFCTAVVARLVSARFLAAQSDSPVDVTKHRTVPLPQLFRRFAHGADGRLVAYLLGLQIAAQIASPFFNPYMLEKLDLSYALYMTIVATSYLTKVVASPWLGRFAARFGARTLLRVGGTGVIPLAWFWTVTSDWRLLLVIQIVSGLAWGALELANLLMFFETIHEHERTSVLTVFNLLNAVATVIGASIGAVLLKRFGETRDAYHTLFLISTVARAGTIVLQARVLAVNVRAKPMIEQTIAVRPALGSINRPILSTLPDESADSTGEDRKRIDLSPPDPGSGA
ncbi:MAG: MFS transporter [Phycisphaerae bacterium]|nr:MAG: MFS transporter [Planctomycetota bacterium]MBE7458747.1 MFS transporter [Planctomycetia bacterium]MCK6465632.1 MFS transporter [Phycisphaerae bacterium]MCL4720201.1 MFS transporter [Phycisphaerae bacterium]MCQ3922517.1 MFS transporter [Planctomycetota bacterium]